VYHQQYARHQEHMRNTLSTMGLMEVVFAAVTAVALATLNYISVSQRQSELGVLSALGHGNWRLVWRLLRETALTTGAAWGISIGLCLLSMLILHSSVFVPLGLRLNLINPIPWLFTMQWHRCPDIVHARSRVHHREEIKHRAAFHNRQR
jgi:ABC-type antimicrobial peptide transport system permease subunit